MWSSISSVEHKFVCDVIQLIDEGIVQDRSEKPLRPIATVVASKDEKERFGDVAKFIEELKERYPYAQLVVGDTSPVEKAAAIAAGMYGMPVEIVKKADKGEWDEGAEIRDEKVVARATHAIAFDDSARSKHYKALAVRQGKYFQRV